MIKKFWAPILVFLAAMLWATDAPFRVFVAADLPSNFIVLVEHFFSLLILIPFLIPALPKLKGLSKKDWASLLIIGIGSSAVALILFTESFKLLNPSAAILLQKLQPFFAIVLASLLLKEHPKKSFWLYALVAVVGAYLISFPGGSPETFAGETWKLHTVGVLCALGAALLWAAGTVFGRIVLTKFSFKETTALRFLIAFVFLCLWNLKDQTFGLVATLSVQSILFLFIMSMVSGAVGLLLYYKGLRSTPASVATIAELGFVAASLLVNYFFLGATLSLMQIMGMTLLLIAVLALAKKQESTQSAVIQ